MSEFKLEITVPFSEQREFTEGFYAQKLQTVEIYGKRFELLGKTIRIMDSTEFSPLCMRYVTIELTFDVYKG